MSSFKSLLLLITISFLTFSCGQNKQKNEGTTKIQAFEKKSISTPDEAISELTSGNNRFVLNQLVKTNYQEQIESSKKKQTPHSVILSCMDSRVPPEIIFDQGIGNIFAIRIAGNIEDENVIGSMEYAVEHAGSKLIVVMGHSHCGAVSGALKNIESGHLTQLVNQIKPAIPQVRDQAEVTEITAKNNVKLTIQDILNQSEIIKELVDSGKIKIVGAFYDVETGKVLF
jgi:carbonic anhydrase